jgi:hypothetical protein
MLTILHVQEFGGVYSSSLTGSDQRLWPARGCMRGFFAAADVLCLWLVLDDLAGCFTMQILGDLSSEQSQE